MYTAQTVEVSEAEPAAADVMMCPKPVSVASDDSMETVRWCAELIVLVAEIGAIAVANVDPNANRSVPAGAMCIFGLIIAALAEIGTRV